MSRPAASSAAPTPAGSGERGVPVPVQIVSSPECFSEDDAAHRVLQPDDAFWLSAAGRVSDLAFVFEAEQAYVLERFEWKGDGQTDNPARMSLEAQVGEAWHELSAWDAERTDDWQSQTLTADTSSKMWRLILLRNHGSSEGMALTEVRFVGRPKQMLAAYRFGAKLLSDHDFADVEVLVGDRRFRAHRALLAAASPAFSAMLRSDLREGRSGEIRLEDTDEASVQATLEYVYTGVVPETAQFGVALMAHRYEIEGLLELAAPIALRNVTVDCVAASLRMLKPYADDETLGAYWWKLLDVVRDSRELYTAAMLEY